MSGIKGCDFDRNSLHGVQFGNLHKITAEKPYYFLEVRKTENEGEDFKRIRLASARELRLASVIREKLFAELGKMFNFKQHEWEDKINELSATVKECEAPSKADPALRRMFERYLLSRANQASSLIHIIADKVYLKNDVYHFCLEGFMGYLRMKRQPRNRINFRNQLISFGCREGEISYSRPNGTTNTIKCWMKDSDDSLREMTVCYQDMLDKNSQVIAKNKLNKYSIEEPWEEPWYVEKGTIFE